MKNNQQLMLRKLIAKALHKRVDAIKVEKLEEDQRYSSRKQFYKVQVGAKSFYHVTQGEKLQSIYNNTLQFHQEFPSCTCKPVAFIDEEGCELLIQEFYEGENLETLVSSGSISDDELNEILADLASILNSSRVSSSPEAALVEFGEFSEQLLSCRALSKADRVILADCLLPELEHLLIGDISSRRWTNGDLIGQNILLSKEGEIRIVDCEFAKFTHFYHEDWVRLKIFSNSKISASSAFVSEYREIPRVFEAYFWLNQVLLADHVFSVSKANEYIPRYLNKFYEIFKCYSGAFHSASLIVGGLAEQNDALNHLLSQAESELATERNLKTHCENEIRDKSALIDEFKKQETNTESLDGIHKKLESIQEDTADRKREFEHLLQELGSKELELQELRENLKQLEDLHEHSKQNLISSESEIQILSTHFAQQKGAFVKMAQAKEDLQRELMLSNEENIGLTGDNMELKRQLREWMEKHNKLNTSNRNLIDENKSLEKGSYLEKKQNHELQKKISDLEIRLREYDKLSHSLQNETESLHHKVEELEALNHSYFNEIQSLKNEAQVSLDKIHRMTCSFSWKITSPLRFLRRHLVDPSQKHEPSSVPEITESVGDLDQQDASNVLPPDPYQQWIHAIEPSTLSNTNNFPIEPRISVVMPIYKPDLQFLKAAIESVIRQSYSNWELCLADDHSKDDALEEMIQHYAKNDKRIRYKLLQKNGHISKCTNAALVLATGEYVAFMDHDDLLREFSLAEMVAALNANPNARFFYSDEDKIDNEERRHSPHFKPDWNPQLILSQNYICHFLMIETALINEVGGLREGVEGSQDWDLVLRTTEKLTSNEIVHIPKVLYHWRESPQSTALNPEAKSYALRSAETVLSDYFKRNDIEAKVELQPTGYFIATPKLARDPTLTIIIPTRNGGRVLERCLNSLVNSQGNLSFDILVMDNGSTEEITLSILRDFEEKYKNITVHRDESLFNFSAINNLAVSLVDTELVLLLNDDTEIITSNWLSQIKAHAIRPEVGAVGVKLLYPNETIQHGGVILGVGGVAGHAFKHLERNTSKQFHRANLPHVVSAVTAAFLCIKRDVFLQAGGLDRDDLKIAFNDIDFCLKVRELGFNNLYLPSVEAYHYESYSRGYEDTPEKQHRFAKEVAVMRKRWGLVLDNDPFYSPNFSLRSEQFDIRTY